MPRIIKSAKGSFTASSITVDGSGRVITASSGSGGANMQLVTQVNGPASGNYVADPSATKFQAYLYGGGGGGGGGSTYGHGGTGGNGGYGFFSGTVSGGTTYSYSVGGPGNAGTASGQNNAGQPGGSGGSSNITNLAVSNGGAGGGGGTGGAAGSAPGAETTSFTRGIFMGSYYPVPAQGGTQGGKQPPYGGTPGSAGNSGAMMIFENSH